MSLDFEGDEPVDSPTYLVVKRKRMQESITRQMNDFVNKNLVVGWASAVSRSDGAERYEDARGVARRARIESGGIEVPAVPMTPDTAVELASCSKTIMAVATVAAKWAVATNFGNNPPPAGFQETCLDTPLAHRLPRDFNVSAIDGTGRFAFRSTNPPDPNPFINLGAPQTTVVTIKDTLRFLAYFSRNVKDRFTSPSGAADAGYYQNLQECVDIGPVQNAPSDRIGRITKKNRKTGTAGRYSNQAYELMRLVIPYILGKAPGVTGTPAAQSLDAMHRAERELMTSLISFNFIRDHVLTPCGVTGADTAPRDDVCYYDMANGLDEFCGPESRFLNFGGSGWFMSAVELRDFLVGVQMGRPFRNDPSWWKKVIRRSRLGMDPGWLSRKDALRTRIVLPGGGTVRAFTKAGGENFPAPVASLPAPAVKTRWLITGDGTTAVLVQNSSAKTAPKGTAPDPYQVLVNAYLAALD